MKTLLIISCIASALILSSGQVATAVDAESKAETKPVIYHLEHRNVRVHDPSTIVKCKDEYWFFCTGNGVSSYRSKDLVKWEAGPRALSGSPAWATNAVPGNRGHFWAPDVIHLGNRYLLYYSVSSWGVKNSAIGMVSNRTLDPADPDYRWTDEGLVIQTGGNTDFNAIDPAVTLDGAGNLWLSIGSFWSGIKLIQLDPATGKRIAPDSYVYPLAHYVSDAADGRKSSAIEAPYIHHQGGYYYLFVNWDRCCQGTNSTYKIRIGRSPKITGPYLDKAGVDMLRGGGTPFLETAGPLIGPGHAGIFTEGGTNWFTSHFYDGNTPRGASMLGIGQLKWAADGWPFLLQVSSVVQQNTASERK